MSERERVVAAATQLYGVTLSLPAPARHAHILHAFIDAGWTKEQTRPLMHYTGFITSTGRFVDRQEARCIADAAEQLITRENGVVSTSDELFSEDVW